MFLTFKFGVVGNIGVSVGEQTSVDRESKSDLVDCSELVLVNL
mgnify:CR=1 FL=1